MIIVNLAHVQGISASSDGRVDISFIEAAGGAWAWQDPADIRVYGEGEMLVRAWLRELITEGEAE